MDWLALVAYFFGGALLINTIPHLVSGLQGRSFQSPFGKPPGVGVSSSTTNMLWGGLNLVVGYLLVAWVGAFDLHNWSHVIALGLGGLLMGTMLARHFGRFHGGNLRG
jgi:hypothetical protein